MCNTTSCELKEFALFEFFETKTLTMTRAGPGGTGYADPTAAGPIIFANYIQTVKSVLQKPKLPVQQFLPTSILYT